jgi:peptidoglycan/xylan/chitin deacetylase (PgdA/CDA1 family)
VDSGDASEPSTGTPEHIARAVLARIGPGSIVVMHENITGNPTVKALRIVLPELRRRGLVPVSLPELLTRDPPTLDAVANGVAGCRSG